MDRETLVAAVEALAVPYHTAANELYATIKEKLNETLVEAGVDKIAKINYSHGDSAEIEVEIPGRRYGHTMNLYFMESHWWNNETGRGKVRKVSLNVGTFGSFDSTMQPEMNFYIVAGALAKELPNLQKKFDAIDFEPYKTACRAYYKAQDELQKFDIAIKEEERAKKIHEIETKFVVGAKLRVGKTYKDEPIYDEIVKSTNKLIWLRNEYGRQTKKTDAIDKIMRGYWEVVA